MNSFYGETFFRKGLPIKTTEASAHSTAQAFENFDKIFVKLNGFSLDIWTQICYH